MAKFYLMWTESYDCEHFEAFDTRQVVAKLNEVMGKYKADCGGWTEPVVIYGQLMTPIEVTKITAYDLKDA